MKIKSITIEGMHNVIRKTYDFSDITYLHGPNGVGKSTVMQAIQLALLGYIPGTAKTNQGVFRHAGNHTMSVTLTLDDNGSDIVIRRVWTGAKSSINTIVDVSPDGYDVAKIISELELPIFNFNEFLDLTANKLKDWFIDFLPSCGNEIDWNSELRKSLVNAGVANIDDDLVNESVNTIKSYGLSGVDEVRRANEYFKDMLSFKKKEADRLQSTVQSLVFYDDVDASENESDVRARIDDYREKQSIRNRQLDLAKKYESMKHQLDEYSDCSSESYESDARVVESNENIKDAENTKSDLNKTRNNFAGLGAEYTRHISEESIAINSIKEKISVLQRIIDGKGICPFTSTKCDSVQSLIDKYKKDIEEYNSEIEKHNNTIDSMQKKKQDINENISGIDIELENLGKIVTYEYNKINEVMNRYSTYNRLKLTIGDEPVVESDDTDYDTLIKEQTELLTKIRANEKYNELIDSFTSEKYQVENQIIAYKSWINLTGVNGLQNDDSATKPFIDLASTMDKYIQAVFGTSVKSKFNLEAKANSFSFGIERRGAYIPFNLLSSGEKCMYTLALMISLVDSSSSPLKLVMVDDLLDHLDSENVVKMFESLKSVNDIQMIFAGVKDIDGNFIVEVKE